MQELLRCCQKIRAESISCLEFQEKSSLYQEILEKTRSFEEFQETKEFCKRSKKNQDSATKPRKINVLAWKPCENLDLYKKKITSSRKLQAKSRIFKKLKKYSNQVFCNISKQNQHIAKNPKEADFLSINLLKIKFLA